MLWAAKFLSFTPNVYIKYSPALGLLTSLDHMKKNNSDVLILWESSLEIHLYFLAYAYFIIYFMIECLVPLAGSLVYGMEMNATG